MYSSHSIDGSKKKRDIEGERRFFFIYIFIYGLISAGKKTTEEMIFLHAEFTHK